MNAVLTEPILGALKTRPRNSIFYIQKQRPLEHVTYCQECKLKSDKIPAPGLIERQRDRILEYWELLYAHQQQRFKKEIQVALLGNHAFNTWKQEGITQLQNSCNYLIETRGFEAWGRRRS